MQTSNVFHAPRFGAYFKKHIVDNLRLYLMSLVVLIGILIALGLLCTFSLGKKEIIYLEDFLPFYGVLLFIAGMIFTGFSFIQLADKPKGIDYLLLPASHLEKFLTTFLITTVGFLLVFHIAFATASFVGVGILSLSRESHAFNNMIPDELPKIMTLLYHWWFMMQAIILLGSVYFPKYSIIKTLFAVFIFIVLIGVINVVFTNILFYGHLKYWAAFSPFVNLHITNRLNGEYYSNEILNVPLWEKKLGYFLWRFILPPALWVLAYFRLKDKEI